MYEGVCRYFGITPKHRLASKLMAGEVPTLVGPNQVFSASVTFQNEGIDETDILHPGDTKTFGVPLVSPAVSGLYPLWLTMTKADARGGDFREEFAALLRVDADPPAVSVLSPQQEAYPYGTQRIEFSAEGHFTFHDHDLKLTLHSAQLQAFGLSRGTATVFGTCTVNHEPGHGFRLELTEGSTGKGGSIRLVLDTGYRFDAPLEGGNITLLSLEGAYSGSR